MSGRLDEIWSFSKANAIFDNGCGTGPIISHILERYGGELPESTTILAGDFSDPMLEPLRKKKATNTQTPGDVWDRLEIRNLDAHDLSGVPDNSVSHVTGGMVYFLLPDPRKALKETHRVLCPGGIVATSNGRTSQHVDALSRAVEKVRPGTHLSLLSGVWTSEAGAYIDG